MAKYEAKMSSDGDTLDVTMFGYIGTDWWGDGSMIDAKAVAASLAANKSAKTINLNINSGGGDPFHALAMYQMFKDHPAKVIANIQGIAASAMTIVTCAADEIVMNAAGLFMYHEAQWGCFGTVAEQQSTLDATQKINDQSAAIYAARTGRPLETIKKEMADTTWMTAEEAKANGFVTQISPLKAMAAQLRPDQFLNVPEHIKPILALLKKEGTEMELNPKPASPPATTPPAAAAAAPAAPTAPAAAVPPAAPAAPPAAAPSAAQPSTDSAMMATMRASDITSACLLAGKPELAPGFINDPKQTSSTVLAAMQAGFIAERAPKADASGAPSGEPAAKTPTAKFEKEYDDEQDLFADMGITKEAYVASCQSTEAGRFVPKAVKKS